MEPPQKKAKVLPCGDIKTEELFIQNFPGYSFSKTLDFIPETSNGENNEVRVIAWVKRIAPKFMQLLRNIELKNEYSLYPLLIDILLPIIELSNCVLRGDIYPETSTEKLETISSNIANLQSKRNSRLASDVAATSTPGQLLSSSPTAASDDLPLNIDTTDRNDVFKFVVLVEHHLRSINKEFENIGRVELAIVDKLTKLVRAVIEAKWSIRADRQAGFYQTGAEMVISRATYGVYTDHIMWQFLKMEGRVIRHSVQYQLMRPNNDKFDQEAVQVFLFLFEIFGVDISIDIEATATRVDSCYSEGAERLVSLLDPTKTGKGSSDSTTAL